MNGSLCILSVLYFELLCNSGQEYLLQFFKKNRELCNMHFSLLKNVFYFNFLLDIVTNVMDRLVCNVDDINLCVCFYWHMFLLLSDWEKKNKGWYLNNCIYCNYFLVSVDFIHPVSKSAVFNNPPFV